MNLLRFVAVAAVLVFARPAAADFVTVYVFDFDYSINLPGGPIVDAVVNVGDYVRWYAIDAFHDSVACAGQADYWNSDTLGMPGNDFTYQFLIPGTFNYYCTPHGQDNGDGTASGMSGSITVLPAPGGVVVLALAAPAAAIRRRRA